MNCSPPAIGPPTPSLKGRRTCLSRPPSFVRTSPVRTITTRGDDSLGLALGPLPVDGDLGHEPLARLGFLVEDLGAAVAVVADRGLPDEDARLARRGLDPLQQVARADQPALPDADLGLVGEPLVDLLADQVDDAIDALERLRRRPLGARLPGVPADGGVLRPGPVGIAGQSHDLVASREQGVGQRRSDHPARSGDEHSHPAADASSVPAARFPRDDRRRQNRQPGEGARLGEIYLSSGRAAWARHLSPVGLTGVTSPPRIGSAGSRIPT